MSQQEIQSTGIKTVICPALSLLYGLNKCLTLSCSGIAYSILFLIALLLSLTGRSRISTLPHCDAGHRIAVSRGDSIHGDKDRHLSCACATLQLEQMPDIILFRDCTLLSFLFLSFSCFPRFFIMMPFSKVRHFLISMSSCGFPVYRGGHFHLMHT